MRIADRHGAFAMTPATVLQNSNLSMQARALYGILQLYARGAMQCWPTLDTLSRETGAHRNTVSAWLRELVDAGILQVLQRSNGNGGKHNLYVLTPPTLTDDELLSEYGSNAQSTVHCPEPNAQSTVHCNAQSTVQQVDTDEVDKGNNPQTPKAGLARMEVPEALAQTWEDWLAYRRQRKLPAYKPATVAKMLTWLSEQPDPAAVVDQSIRQGWQGLFELKGHAGHNGTLQGTASSMLQGLGQ